MVQNGVTNLIKKQGLKVEDVAARMKLDRSTMYRRIQFGCSFNVSELLALAAALGVPLKCVIRAILEE